MKNSYSDNWSIYDKTIEQFNLAFIDELSDILAGKLFYKRGITFNLWWIDSKFFKLLKSIEIVLIKSE